MALLRFIPFLMDLLNILFSFSFLFFFFTMTHFAYLVFVIVFVIFTSFYCALVIAYLAYVIFVIVTSYSSSLRLSFVIAYLVYDDSSLSFSRINTCTFAVLDLNLVLLNILGFHLCSTQTFKDYLKVLFTSNLKDFAKSQH